MVHGCGDKSSHVLVQAYTNCSRVTSHCKLLQALPLGLVRIEAENSFLRQSMQRIKRYVHVFQIQADDEDGGAPILVRDLAYERL